MSRSDSASLLPHLTAVLIHSPSAASAISHSCHRQTDLSSRGSQSACTGFVSLPAHLRAPGPPEPEPAERANEAALCLFTACPEKSLQRANPADAITHVAVTTACSIHACSVSAPLTHDSLWRAHVNQCSCHTLHHIIQNMLSRGERCTRQHRKVLGAFSSICVRSRRA
jgi:hypothetical protein